MAKGAMPRVTLTATGMTGRRAEAQFPYQFFPACKGASEHDVPMKLVHGYAKLARLSDSVLFSGEPQHLRYEELTSSVLRMRGAIVRGLFSPVEAKALRLAATPDPVAREGAASSDDCWKPERQIQSRHRELYSRLVETAWGVDSQIWQRIFSGLRLRPEMHYEQLGARGRKIKEHNADSDSALTAIVLLSDPAEFEGGTCYLESVEEDGEEGMVYPHGRRIELLQGDAIFFQGDQCEQWCMPVQSGERAALTVEFCYGQCWGTPLFFLFSFIATLLATILFFLGEMHIYFRYTLPFMVVFCAVSAERELPPCLRRSRVRLVAFIFFHAVVFYTLAVKIPQFLEEVDIPHF